MDLLNYKSEDEREKESESGQQCRKNKWLQEDSSEEDSVCESEEPQFGTNAVSGLLPASFLFSTDTSEESSFLQTRVQQGFQIPEMKKKEEVPLSKKEAENEAVKKKLIKKISKEEEINDIDEEIRELKSKRGTKPPFKGKGKEEPIKGESAKDRVKRQRLAGQTGIEGGWKSEEHMQMRQHYD